MQALPRFLALSLLLATATATLPGTTAGVDVSPASVSVDGPLGPLASADPAGSTLAVADCPRNCKQEYEDCRDAGGDVQTCEEVFKACFAFCNVWRRIQDAITVALDDGTAATAVDVGDCEDQCRAFLLECSNACGTDQKCVDKCETAANLCMAACRAIRAPETSASGAILPAPACLNLLVGTVDATL